LCFVIGLTFGIPVPPQSRRRTRDSIELVVHERVLRESDVSMVVYLMLTKTNYIKWALVMKINAYSVQFVKVWIRWTTAPPPYSLTMHS
jgi:hypothetical protein